MGVKESAIIIDLILELRRRGEVSIMLIAHNFAHVIEVCDRINRCATVESSTTARSRTPRFTSSPISSPPTTAAGRANNFGV
jgi:ABC-type dipeptide/oligopeptide/nickel transport system ATPase component